MTTRLYCLDSSALIHAAVRAYPFDVFGSFWTRLDVLVQAERAFSPLEVLNELSAVNKMFPSLVDEKRGRSLADPWVVAVAKLRGATVVTMEHRGRGSTVKIPDACAGFQIPCFTLLDLIRKEGWTWP